jgi:hypothetical protein
MFSGAKLSSGNDDGPWADKERGEAGPPHGRIGARIVTFE